MPPIHPIKDRTLPTPLRPPRPTKDMNTLLDIILIALLCTVASMLVGSCTLNLVRSDAIDNGAAIWTVDPVSGETSFEWRGSLPKPPARP